MGFVGIGGRNKKVKIRENSQSTELAIKNNKISFFKKVSSFFKNFFSRGKK